METFQNSVHPSKNNPPLPTVLDHSSNESGLQQILFRVNVFYWLVANAVNILKCTSAGNVSWEAMVTSPGIALAGNR